MKLIDILKELDLPKGKYVTPTAADIDDLKSDLYKLVANAYAPIGGHLKYNSPESMKDPNLKFWRVADIDADPEIDVVYFGKETPFGVKHTGMGHDGERENIKNLLRKKSEELKNPGNYVEVSGAAFDSFVGKGGVPTINDEEAVRKILGDRRAAETIWHGKHPEGKKPGEGWYSRKIGGKPVTKIMIGKIK
jgi:hypothetical protein